MRILIAGAGIGGLTAALALRQAGFDVHVYEQARVLGEVGAGVAIGPNAVKVLHHLGLAAPLRAVGVVSLSMDPRDGPSGAVLARIPLADAAVGRWGAPIYHLHRADLHDVLRRALDDEHLTLGAKCVGVEEADGRVTLRFADGRTVTGGLLIGADGIHSVVRDYVAGPDRPTWSGQIAWRGLAPAAVGQAAGLELRHHSFWGAERQFVTYYVSAGRLVNWVGVVPAEDDWQEESWSTHGDRADALAAFADWHPQVRALIAGTEQVAKWGLFDRPPLATWVRGRVTVLGDAAHPMLPYMAQGASQSIEDAFVLTYCLAQDRDEPARAIQTYAARRRERTDAVQAASRSMGRTTQLSDPAEVAARNARMRKEADAYADRYDWLWGYDLEQAMANG